MPANRDEVRYEALKQSIVDLGLIRHGSLVRRFMPCGKPGCRCQATPPQLHGPYYQWTRKVHGKTVTVRLTQQEAGLLADWIQNGRRLDKILAEMEAVAMRLTNRMLKKLPKESANP
jgi:hypothetical protein